MPLHRTAAAGLLLLALSGSTAAGAAWPPPERLLEWKPGVPGGIPAVPVTVALQPADLPADGKTDCSAALQKAIDGAPTPGAVLLPPGTFLLSKRVSLKSGVVLRGAGLDKTHLVVNAPTSTFGGALQARGERGSREFPIAAGAARGSRQLTLASADGLKPGTLVWVYSDNDPALLYTKKEWDVSWANHSMGQLVLLSAVAGAAVTLDEPLRLDYQAALKPRLRELTPVTGVGFEDFHIRREDQAEDSIIAFINADGGWVRGCETEYAMVNHIQVSRGRHVTIENCYSHHAHSQGSGGRGYGVALYDCASDCLVQNNIFHTLRHAMIIQCGVNGCVYAYNYSFDTALYVDANKEWSHSNDISVHGHYAYASLFEGNVVQRAGLGDYWGPAGPRLTLFRNRIAAPEKARDLEHYKQLGIRNFQMGLFVKDSSHGANVLGNTLTEDAALEIEASCKDVLVEGNLSAGQIKWNQTPPCPLPASLYLKAKPAFWGAQPWPCIGADVDAQALTPLPAQDWHARIKQAGHPVPFAAASKGP